MFLQIRSSPDSSEVAFTAEQTLLFYFAFSVILTCKLDKILIIILMSIRPCDWGKKWDTDNAKLIHKILWKIKWLLHREISSPKMYTFIVFLYSNILFVQNGYWPYRCRLMLLKWKRKNLHADLQRILMLIFSTNSVFSNQVLYNTLFFSWFTLQLSTLKGEVLTFCNDIRNKLWFLIFNKQEIQMWP